MFIYVETFLFDTLVDTQAVHFLDTVEQHDTTTRPMIMDPKSCDSCFSHGNKLFLPQEQVETDMIINKLQLLIQCG